MAPRVAALIRWPCNTQDMWFLQRWALNHDMPEAIMGDPPSPLKSRVEGYKEAEKEFAIFFPKELGTMLNLIEKGEKPWGDIAKIVKCVDYVEAAMFLCTEMKMGNHAVRETFDLLGEKAWKHWQELPDGFKLEPKERKAALREAWLQAIGPMMDSESPWEVIE